ncbi:MAG: tRNA N6-adenosine threonylcarbamoyltransferase [Patescibacteria group bacterium]|nr:tRNA N6-adenosine threonylcarbamoyltransferase [Patescibacteria group bacterium]
MILWINTTREGLIEVALKTEKKEYKKRTRVSRYQDSKLLVVIAKLLEQEKVTFKDIKKIEVVDCGGSFTSLRIGVLTANALAYAYKIPIQASSGAPLKSYAGYKLVAPIYNREPNIGKKKVKHP